MWFVVLCLEAVMGFGVVSRLLPRAGAMRLLSVSVLLGLAMSSGVVFLMDLLHVPLRPVPFLIGLAVAAAAANAGALGQYGRLRGIRPALPRPAEGVFLAVILVLVLESLWRSFYLDGLPRDAIVGMDLVAKYAVKEGTIHSSVFTWNGLDGYRSNQPYYAPFTMLMQIVFRLAGGELGGTWLGIMLVAFVVFTGGWLRERVHPAVSGLLLVCLLAVPMFHTYTSFVITDYPNAVYFGLAAVFLYAYTRDGERGALVLSSLFMACVCWSRSESILLVPYAVAVLLVSGEGSMGKWVRRAVLYAVPPAVAFLAWNWLYVTLVLGGGPGGQVRAGLPGLAEVGDSVRLMLVLLADETLFGSLIFLFLAVLILDLAVFRNTRGLWLAGWTVYLFVAFVVIVAWFPAASVEFTVKRGFLKLLPVMVFYMGQSRTLEAFSGRLAAWEAGTMRGRGKARMG